jgi:hypothetical protein
MFGAWALALTLIRRVTLTTSLASACAGVLIFGWMPLSAEQSVAEGHNDIVMVAGMLCWILLLERGRRLSANLALMGSVLIKYVSAPLFVLSIVRARFSQPRWRTSWVDLGVPLIAAFLIALPFGADTSLFTPLLATRGASGYGLQGAFATLVPCCGSRVAGMLTLAARGVLVFVAAGALVRYARLKTNEAARQAALAFMLTVLLASGWRVLPWYFLWPLSLAALEFSSLLSRWTTGVALAMPAMWMWFFLVLQRPPRMSDAPLVLAVYVCGFLWVWVTRVPRRPAAVRGVR